MNIKELLPIGSVVLLKGGKKRLMVFGVKQKKGDTGEEFDYIGVIYQREMWGIRDSFYSITRILPRCISRDLKTARGRNF